MSIAAASNDRPGDSAPAGRRRLRPLMALVPYALRYPGLLAGAAVALVVASLATLVVPLAIRRMIDFGFSAEGMISQYFAMLVGVALVLAIASASRFYLVTTIGERVVADIRAAVFSHLAKLSPSFFDTAKTGEVISRLTADTTQIKSAVGVSVSIALRNLIMFVGALAMMVVTSPRLSLYAVAAIPILVLPLVAFGRDVRRRSRLAQDRLADASAYANENIQAVRTMQAFTAERTVTGRFVAAAEEAFTTARDANRARAILTAVVIFLVFSSVVAILWAGAQEVLAGTMSSGRLSQFVLYAVFAAGALSELSQVWSDISQAAGAAERLVEILAVEPEVKAPARPLALPEPARGEVSFVAVRFAYPVRPEARVLDEVSFEVKRGEKVAIVGPSGAGKSTLFSLLLRFYDPAGGVVRFDGVPIAEVDPEALRRRIALVPQDVAIFAASVADNIRYGRPEADDAAVVEAARLAFADEFIARLPEGYASQIGERGVTLSGGQRQRIAIARAILRDAPLLLLDEATSALDAESETMVQKALERLMEGRTTLVIAHRLATVLNCDRILVMDEGRIVEEGSHAELVARGGLYARLAELQFNGSRAP
ncbi:ABC transporter transmembrane domain-containing protein [Phreatobacter sp. AB_2022a]|uniref:ABC transporter transmembrane domain-containing protein n=1 Tax=Phreatobacter sp. AB_2022a TaxID=3003134 RepID=UPI002286D1CC|nr:ABC transporter transmembrane domain-containing protein [Phreatobacter sp. AB_2022a]MCZ0738129.1 ABC transporter transmembrane domain-containing protein [Phreatobacter sp. AB_2022a]